MMNRENGSQGPAERLRADLQELLRDLRDGRAELGDLLAEQLGERPYVALSAAAALGFALGGGLPRGTLGLMVGLGSRAAASWLGALLVAPPVSSRRAYAQPDGPLAPDDPRDPKPF
jgi:hypothetical protein